LVRAGHRSLVIACDGSKVDGDLIAVRVPSGIVDDDTRTNVYEKWRAAIQDTIQRHHVDVVHMHSLDFHQYAPAAGPPVVVTVHLPFSFYPAGVLRSLPPRTVLACVSQSQLRSCPEGIKVADVIENGVEQDRDFTPFRADREYVLALGRICPEKGFHLAVEAANAAGVPLYLGGKVFPYQAHLEYFERDLAPRLRPPHKFLGPLGVEAKLAFLAGARCLVAPSLVAETSSLVTMEALSVGTPVVAFPSGALPELIDEGRTGFLVNTVSEMADAIRRVDSIDREQCRRVARQRFSSARMIGQYLSLYDRLRRSADELSQTTA
jgi:glycosyltransferase involved in cell wall biosynthesis